MVLLNKDEVLLLLPALEREIRTLRNIIRDFNPTGRTLHIYEKRVEDVSAVRLKLQFAERMIDA